MATLRQALEATFLTRKTHTLPAALVPPPTEWASEFVEMATEAGLSTTDCGEAFVSLKHFWEVHGLGVKPGGSVGV